MSRRLGWMLLLAAVLATALMLDRFVLRRESPDRASAPVHRAAQKEAAGESVPMAQNKLFLPPLSTFREIWTRPVFAPSRRPEAIVATPRTPVGPAPGNDQQAPAIKIVGVAIGPDGSAALVRTARNTVKRYYVDDVIEGWTIEQIKPDNVTVSRQGARWLLPVGMAQ